MRGATSVLVALATGFGFAGTAWADSTLDLDINVAQAQTFAADGVTPFYTTANHFDGTFGPRVGDYSGVVQLSQTASTTLSEVRIDGTPFSRLAGDLTSDVSTLSGQLTLTNGVVQGGFFEVTLSNGDAFVTNVVPLTGVLRIGLDNVGTIDGLTMSGVFSSTGGTFAGVPLGAFDTTNLFGSFLTIKLNPTGPSFIDSNSDLTLSAVVPLPTAAGLGLAGLSLLGLRRRRMAA